MLNGIILMHNQLLKWSSMANVATRIEKIMEGKYHSIPKDVALLKVTKLLLRLLIPHSLVTSQLVVRMRFLFVRSVTNGIIELLSALIDSTIHSLQMISQKHLQL